MTDISDNPRAVIGSNVPDWAAEETARLQREHEALDRDVSNALDEARELPPEVKDENDATLYTGMIKRMRDITGRIEALREGEKAPHLRRSQAVDSFFFRLFERLERRKRTDAAGGIDVLTARLHSYNEARLRAERLRREEEERRAREEALKAQREREAAERVAREAEAAAARARSEETRAKREEEARVAREAAEKAAAEARDLAEAQQAAAEQARAKSSDLTRERHESGAINTMKQVWHYEITDQMELDIKALQPFIKEDHLLMALKSWAKVTGHKKQMPGAIIEQRDETRVV